MGFLNVSHVVELQGARGGRLAAPNYPAPGPSRASLRARLLAPPRHTLTLALHGATLAPPLVPIEESLEEPKEMKQIEPCGLGNGWIEVFNL